MRIATIGISIEDSQYLNGYISNKIDDKVFKAINVFSNNKDQSRGVLVLNKRFKETENAKSLAYYYNTLKLTIDSWKYIFDEFIIKLLNLRALAGKKIILLPFIKNYISFEPENQFYSGYIICFENYLPHKIKTIFEIYSNQDDVVITNQTNFNFLSYDDITQTGTLVVIHCSEAEPVELEFYTYTYNCKESKSFLSKFKGFIKPKKYNSILPEIEFVFKLGSKKDINIEPDYFQQLYQACNGSIKEVYEVMSDIDLQNDYTEQFFEKSKSLLVNKKLLYTKDSII